MAGRDPGLIGTRTSRPRSVARPTSREVARLEGHHPFRFERGGRSVSGEIDKLKGKGRKQPVFSLMTRSSNARAARSKRRAPRRRSWATRRTGPTRRSTRSRSGDGERPRGRPWQLTGTVPPNLATLTKTTIGRSVNLNCPSPTPAGRGGKLPRLPGALGVRRRRGGSASGRGVAAPASETPG